jgi:hypothetical protein
MTLFPLISLSNPWTLNPMMNLGPAWNCCKSRLEQVTVLGATTMCINSYKQMPWEVHRHVLRAHPKLELPSWLVDAVQSCAWAWLGGLQGLSITTLFSKSDLLSRPSPATSATVVTISMGRVSVNASGIRGLLEGTMGCVAWTRPSAFRRKSRQNRHGHGFTATEHAGCAKGEVAAISS